MPNDASETKTLSARIKFIYNFVELAWKPMAFIFGVIGVIYSFVKSFRGDNSTFTWIIAGVGFSVVVVVLLVIAFAKETYETSIFPRRKTTRFLFPNLVKPARVGLGIVAGLIVVSTGIFYYNYKEQERKFVIVVANFSNIKDSTDSVTGKIITQLKQAFPLDNPDSVVVTPGMFISEQQGRTEAVNLGQTYQADLVIWGWYEKTNTNTLVTVHVENLIHQGDIPLAASEVREYKPDINEFNTFTFQEQLSSGMVSLALFANQFFYYKSGNYPKAIEIMTESLKHYSETGRFVGHEVLLDYRGNLYLLNDQYNESLKDFAQATTIAPNYASAYVGYGLAYWAMGNFDLAIQKLTMAIKMEQGQNPISLMDRGVVYATHRDFDLALADFGAALSLKPDFVDALLQRAGVYSERGDLLMGLSDVNHALRLKISPDAYNVRGNIQADLGNLQAAIEDYTLAIKVDPSYLPAFYNRGNVFAREGKYDEAIADFTTDLSLRPNHVQSLDSRGYTYMVLSDSADRYERKCTYLFMALNDYQQAIKLSSQAGLYFNRAIVYRKMGENRLPTSLELCKSNITNSSSEDQVKQYYLSSVEDYSRVIELIPDDYVAYYNRARVFVSLNKSDKAIDDLRLVVGKSSNRNLVQDAKKRLEELGILVP